MALFSSRPVVLFLAAVVVGAGLLACSGSDDARVVTDDEEGPIPDPETVERALNQALQAFNDYCLAPKAQGGDASYPLSLFNPDAQDPSFTYRQLRALAQAGLLDTTITRGQRDLPVYRFGLTQTGRSAQYDVARGRTLRPMFCYAVPTVTRIDSIKAVYSSGPNPLTNVWFSYSYEDFGDWIETPSVQSAFTGLPSRPSRTDTIRTEQLLIRIDSAWIDRRLSGYDRSAARAEEETEQTEPPN